MFDINAAIVVFCAKCARVIAESQQALTTDDVQDAYETFMELEGMAELLSKANGVSYVGDVYPSVVRRYNEAWAAWNMANSRVNYDPETGRRRVVV